MLLPAHKAITFQSDIAHDHIFAEGSRPPSIRTFAKNPEGYVNINKNTALS
jgi:hypothetical protein